MTEQESRLAGKIQNNRENAGHNPSLPATCGLPENTIIAKALLHA
jgi:hypothetical protein